MKRNIKIIIGLMLSILLIGGAIAVGESLSNKDITIKEKPEVVYGDITFKVDGVPYTCSMSEKDGIDINDIETCAIYLGIPSKKVLTDIKDWNGDCFKEDRIWGEC